MTFPAAAVTPVNDGDARGALTARTAAKLVLSPGSPVSEANEADAVKPVIVAPVALIVAPLAIVSVLPLPMVRLSVIVPPLIFLRTLLVCALANVAANRAAMMMICFMVIIGDASKLERWSMRRNRLDARCRFLHPLRLCQW